MASGFFVRRECRKHKRSGVASSFSQKAAGEKAAASIAAELCGVALGNIETHPGSPDKDFSPRDLWRRSNSTKK